MTIGKESGEIRMNELTTDHYDRIKTFMKSVGEQHTPKEIIEPSLEVRKLRAKLTLEECLEKIKALGFTVLQENELHIDFENITIEISLDAGGLFDIVEVIDACCDLSVVTIGTLISCGVPDIPFLFEVDNNNINKIQTGTIREDGKLVKHPDHKPPRIKEILEGIKNRDPLKGGPIEFDDVKIDVPILPMEGGLYGEEMK